LEEFKERSDFVSSSWLFCFECSSEPDFVDSHCKTNIILNTCPEELLVLIVKKNMVYLH
jgi:hypothetical protein